ncbi:hypothetical protein NP493_221g02013 [Ridgeia piscesae]|uniref:G-protein coupled receptors family 1 profile domain-containing protein n=1 Tax=Ridgeia piscesae TaxID=27915 RepID=A0AAD9P0E4_RIDPI|nr:hypothetical protein NP493_221g02013 [Ridgeia piscesae]
MNVTVHDATFADVLHVTEDLLSDKSAGVATTNATFDLTQLLGPRREALYKVIPMTVVYCVIFVTGVVGNVCTCLVIRRTKYMQTVTNYYLFNLAVADLLVLLLGLPQETYSFWSAYPWVFGETFCVLRTMAAETSTYASILTITAFTVERYVAICHLMLTQAGSSLRRAVKVIVLLWVVSAVCSVPMVVQFGLVYVTDDTGTPVPESVTCNIKPDRYLRHAFETSTFLFFLAPMTVITVLYALIGVAIRRSTLSRSSSDTSTQSGPRRAAEARTLQQARARRAVLKMLDTTFRLVYFRMLWWNADRGVIVFDARARRQLSRGLRLL